MNPQPVGQGLRGLTLLLSWGSIKVRSSSVRRMRLGPLNSWICWILLLQSDHGKSQSKQYNDILKTKSNKVANPLK